MSGPRIATDMDEVRKLHAQGWTCLAIARHFGVPYATMNKRTLAAGLNFLPARSHIDMDAVRAMHAQGMTLKAIAHRLGVHYNTLNERTVRAGMSFRNCPRAKRKPASKRKPEAPPVTTPKKPSEQERTRAILDLCVAREIAPHWEKSAITQKIEAMRA